MRKHIVVVMLAQQPDTQRSATGESATPAGWGHVYRVTPGCVSLQPGQPRYDPFWVGRGGRVRPTKMIARIALYGEAPPWFIRNQRYYIRLKLAQSKTPRRVTGGESRL